jgi:hypothetical protein
MIPTPTRRASLWHLVATIMASVAVGAMFITAFQRWLRGDLFVMWVLLMVMMVFVLVLIVNAMAVLKRIP